MDGIVIINKEKEYTSHDVVAKVKKILNEKKVGHTGTLDPNATGVLPILLGKGTKLSKYLINHDKIYNVTLKLGEKTDTADIEGKVIEQKNVNLQKVTKENITKILNSFIGKQQQIPPMYSAIKVNGKKLYEYARSGQTVELTPRKIEIYNIRLLNINTIITNSVEEDITFGPNVEITFQVHCSKGTYVRSLCEDIAKKLDTVGYMKELQRIKVGDFNIKNSITLGQLEKDKEKNVISIEEFLNEKPQIILNNKKIDLLLNGIQLKVKNKSNIYRIYNEQNKFIGTGIIENELLKRDIIL